MSILKALGNFFLEWDESREEKKRQKEAAEKKRAALHLLAEIGQPITPETWGSDFGRRCDCLLLRRVRVHT